MKNKILFPLLSALLASCASVHPGTMAKLHGSSSPLPLEVSIETIERNAGTPFQLVQVTYENTSDEWVRISKVEALTGEAKNKISVVVGGDLVSWAEAMEAREAVDKHNRELLQSGLVVAGAGAAVAGGASGNDAVAAAGLATMVGTTAWAAVGTLTEKQRIANSPKHVPSTHLYTATTVPPGLFVRRWILFNKPKGTHLPWVVFTAETADGKKATYTVDLREEE